MPPEGYPCFEIVVTYPSSDPNYRQSACLYFRQDTGNLIRIQDVSGRKGVEPDRSGAIEFPPDPNGPILPLESALVPLSVRNMFDFPDFTKDPNFSTENGSGPDKRVISQTVTSQTIKQKDNVERKEYEITMIEKRNSYEYRTVQKWRKGDPWWYETRQFENGNAKGYETVLVRPNATTK
jgi:hypothetical protein